VPDQRSHRGPHPADPAQFASSHWPALRAAVEELSWLFERNYAWESALKLVGDRHQLRDRQRLAVLRCSAAESACRMRARSRVPCHALAGRTLWIDGYNLLTTVEAALSGGLILGARDGTYRDLASMHGTFRQVEETPPALQLLGRWLASQRVRACRWLFDQPVSNSGRLKTLVRELAAQAGWDWQVELVPNPDEILKTAPEIVVTADSAILDRAPAWANAARAVVAEHIPAAWVVDLADQIAQEWIS